jgi:hypothetical protein
MCPKGRELLIAWGAAATAELKRGMGLLAAVDKKGG